VSDAFSGWLLMLLIGLLAGERTAPWKTQRRFGAVSAPRAALGREGWALRRGPCCAHTHRSAAASQFAEKWF